MSTGLDGDWLASLGIDQFDHEYVTFANIQHLLHGEKIQGRFTDQGMNDAYVDPVA